MNQPQVTVLGASGFIGSALVRHLAERGVTCHAPPRDTRPGPGRRWGHVVYAIGLTADFRRRPLETVQAHVCLLREWLERAEFSSLTYLSSTRIYGSGGATHEGAALQVEPQRPDDLYNLSKLMGESLCLHSGRAGAKVARLSNVVGVRKDTDIFIDQILDEIVRTGALALKSPLSTRKDYIDLDDVVRALADLALADVQGVFNVASGEMTSHRAIIEHLRRHFDFALTAVADAPLPPGSPIDVSRIASATGFRARAFDDYFPDFLVRYKSSRGLA